MPASVYPSCEPRESHELPSASVLAAFYYGNLTRPSQDPPRIGLLSTVPSDGAERLKEAISAAEAAHAPLAGALH